jgi:NAD(P)-dependent dehydrogenase (short-subunit alcohol dehydrogenase family)
LDLELKGKRAVVSGGSRGIGKAIARELAREGCSVVLGARTKQTLDDAAAEISRDTGAKVVGISVDTTDVDSIKSFMKLAGDTLGGVDILVNSAARVGGAAGGIEVIDENEIIADFTEKVIGYMRMAREAVPYMKQNNWGRIINISGLAGRNPGTSLSGGARNAATVNMTKALSNDLGKYGINVTAIYPGQTVTERTYDTLESQASQQNTTVEALLEKQAERSVIRHNVTAEDIAHVVTFICSPLAVSITGEAIAVAGGQSPDVHF